MGKSPRWLRARGIVRQRGTATHATGTPGTARPNVVLHIVQIVQESGERRGFGPRGTQGSSTRGNLGGWTRVGFLARNTHGKELPFFSSGNQLTTSCLRITCVFASGWPLAARRRDPLATSGGPSTASARSCRCGPSDRGRRSNLGLYSSWDDDIFIAASDWIPAAHNKARRAINHRRSAAGATSPPRPSPSSPAPASSAAPA